MEDCFIKDIEKFDNKLIKDYVIKIRTEIFDGLKDLIKRNDENDENYEIIIFQETKLFNILKRDFINIYKHKSEEVKKLTKLIEIYKYLTIIFNNNLFSNESLNNIKSLIKD